MISLILPAALLCLVSWVWGAWWAINNVPAVRFTHRPCPGNDDQEDTA